MMTPAFAQTAAAAAQPSIFEMLMPFILIAVVFYFLLIRPQQKRLKEHRAMISAIKRGDVVVTAGGLIAKVVRVSDDSDEIELDLGNDMKVRALRSTISEVRGKTQPQPAAKPARKGNSVKKTDAATPAAPATPAEGDKEVARDKEQG